MTTSNTVEFLLVEDDPQDVELSLRALRAANLTNNFHVARDGSEAMDFIFCEGAHAGRRITDAPKVILLDLILPKVEGLEVLKRLRSDPRTQRVPVVVLISSNEQMAAVETFRLDVNSYIMKPVTFERFAEAVRDLGLFWLLSDEPAPDAD